MTKTIRQNSNNGLVNYLHYLKNNMLAKHNNQLLKVASEERQQGANREIGRKRGIHCANRALEGRKGHQRRATRASKEQRDAARRFTDHHVTKKFCFAG